MTPLEQLKKDNDCLKEQIMFLLKYCLAATSWSPNHTTILNNKYQKGTLVWYEDYVYECLVANNSIPVNNEYYWHKINLGHLLAQEVPTTSISDIYTFVTPLINTDQVISILQAAIDQDGYLSAIDWETFNNKQDALPIDGSSTQYLNGEFVWTDFPATASTLEEVLVNGRNTGGRSILVNNADSIELENGSLLKKGTYSFGGFGDIIVSGITNANDGYINGVMGWGNPSGTQWSDLNGNYAKTSVAVTPSGYSNGLQGMHTPEPGTFNYYLELISNPTFNGIAYFLAPGNRSGWGDPDDDTTTDPPVDYWRLCVGSDWPHTYFTNPSDDPYIFPTSGWVPVSDTIPNSEGGYGYDYIANYNEGFTASISYVLNGNGGISRICSQGYEDMWQAGVRYVFGNSGYIRHATNGFDIIPDASFDYTKRFAVGSLWTLDNGDTYECTNADLNEAVWVLTTVDLSGYIPYTGATENVDLGEFTITAAQVIKDGGQPEQFLKADGSVDNNVYLTSASLASNIILYPTNAQASVTGYYKLVTSLNDPDYNTEPVDIPTGNITTTDQLIANLASEPNILVGNPGVFNITIIGNIRKTVDSGSGEATFFFKAYKRTSGGTETLVATSDPTIPVDSDTYTEFSASGIWNDGDFLSTDRIVLKFYANRIAGGSDPNYEIQFGGSTPVRTFVPVPIIAIPNIYLKDLADVENVAPEDKEILYWNDVDSLWEHTSLKTVAGQSLFGTENIAITSTATSRQNANNSTNPNINYCGVAIGANIPTTNTAWTIKKLTISAAGVPVVTTTTTLVRWVDRELPGTIYT
jgi:hypothetical protein